MEKLRSEIEEAYCTLDRESKKKQDEQARLEKKRNEEKLRDEKFRQEQEKEWELERKMIQQDL